MPWTAERYPRAMQGMAPEVRLKAIEIANAMLREGIEEGKAIRMAITAARRWASGHSRRGSMPAPSWVDWEGRPMQ